MERRYRLTRSWGLWVVEYHFPLINDYALLQYGLGVREWWPHKRYLFKFGALMEMRRLIRGEHQPTEVRPRPLPISLL
jgi:hypothetical protein